MIPTDSEPTDPKRHFGVVERSQHGMQLLDYLASIWPKVDRTALRNVALDGGVSVNADEFRKPKRRLRQGDVVDIELPDLPENLKQYRGPQAKGRAKAKAQDAPLEVLYEDEAILVVVKPPGLGAARDKTGKYAGAIDRLVESRGEPELRLVHKPDRFTSGCLVVARNLEVARELEAALGDGRMTGEYLALVSGAMRGTEHFVEKALGPDRRRPGRIAVVDADSKGARAAQSRVAVAAKFRRHTLVRVQPVTWRNHQVRVHLSFLGHPIVADPDYGVRNRLLLSEIKKDYKARPGVVERPLLERMFLHLERVRIPDVRSAKAPAIEVEAPLPKDLRVVLNKLENFAAK